jgi:hypothetical protein
LPVKLSPSISKIGGAGVRDRHLLGRADRALRLFGVLETARRHLTRRLRERRRDRVHLAGGIRAPAGHRAVVLTAQLWESPVLREPKVPAGGVARPSVSSPRQASVASFLMAQVWS